MSESIRQNNLLSAEDYKKIFKAYNFIDYTSYDFDSLKQALITYIQTYYPENFVDYTESSEFIAIIELIAYLGTSLAFRADVNSRENFIDTAERRESIIRLAQMVNYVPRRNVAASGLFKVSSVRTNQLLTDANGLAINDTAIYWNDPNNADWFDQYIQILNAAFNRLNPFGRPSKSGTIGSIPTDLYQLNNILRLNVAYQVSVTINGQQYPIDVCNPDFIDGGAIFERDPDPSNSFNFIYRNDGLGSASANSGFFLYFKQGTLINLDANFEYPVPNRLYDIDIQNINQDDVYVQETDSQGNVVTKWKKVPAISGENIIYNSIQHSERNIFQVITGANDTVSIRFADGNFGNIPTGLIRTWVRPSANQSLIIRPDNAKGLQLDIPYIGVDNQQYILSIIFDLEQTIGNATPTETNEQIRQRAPEVFSTQSRMVNGSDYNVLPLIYGNQLLKVHAINRTYSGHSRYIDTNDPTGFHKDIIVLGDDGALFRDSEDSHVQIVRDLSNETNIKSVVVNSVSSLLKDTNLFSFFYDEYLTQFEKEVRVDVTSSSIGYSLLELSNPNQATLYWKTVPSKFKNDTGYFSDINGNPSSLSNDFSGVNRPWGFIKAGSVIEVVEPTDPTNLLSVSVSNVIQQGIPTVTSSTDPYSILGPVELGKEVQTLATVAKVYPMFRNTLTTQEIALIEAAVDDGKSFWLYYNLIADTWGVVAETTTIIIPQISSPFVYPTPATGTIHSTWNTPDCGLLYVKIANNNQDNITTYDLTARGRVYVFESYKDVRFYWDSVSPVIDSATNRALKDTITVMPYINTNSMVDNNVPNPALLTSTTSYIKTPVAFNISGVFAQDDGYVDNSKIKVRLVDNDLDGVADNPGKFASIVSATDRIVYEHFYNSMLGYVSSRPWLAKWDTSLTTDSGDLYLYFPVNQLDTTQLYSAPYIANKNLKDLLPSSTTDRDYQIFISDPAAIKTAYPVAAADFRYVFLDEADLIFVNNSVQLKYDGTTSKTLANQLSAFFNIPVIPTHTAPFTVDEQAALSLHGSFISAYPWLVGTENLINRRNIISNYFINKVFMLGTAAPGYASFYKIEYGNAANLATYPSSYFLDVIDDTSHFDKNGKIFTQNYSVREDNRIPFHFKWNHYAPLDQRVDPSISNIIDMVAITNGYYRDMIIWKNSNGSLATKPMAPTTEELRTQFQNLDQYKMVSDTICWRSGKFTILFGPQAIPELQATFKVVKSSSTTVNDNEVKTRVIQAIDTYFDIRNWDFGEKFYYTELAAFIHQQLSRIISSIVIVPNNASSSFGNLFEITANSDELFLSTATVNNVVIVSGLTEQNMRI